MPRIDLIQQRTDVPPEDYALFDELAARRGRISGPSSVVMHSRGLARPWNEISEYLHGLSPVEPKYAELAVCTTARENDCAYIWAAHVPQARSGGVSEAAIAAARERLLLDDLSQAEAATITFVRQLTHAHRVDAQLFAGLLQAHGERWLVDLSCWIGRYSGLSCILNAFEVAPAPEADQLPVLPVTPQASTVRPPEAAPRVTPITSRDQVAAADASTFDLVAEGRGSVRGPWSLLMFSPQLCRRVLDVSNYLRHGSPVSARTRELVTIATAREKNCPYVWAAHAPAARNEGVDDAIITAVRTRAAVDSLSAGDRALVEYARQLLPGHRVTQQLFDQLIEEHGIPGLVDITAVIGHYVFVTSLLNAFEVSPAAGAEALDA